MWKPTTRQEPPPARFVPLPIGITWVVTIGWAVIAVAWAVLSVYDIVTWLTWGDESGALIDAQLWFMIIGSLVHIPTWIVGVVFIVWMSQAYTSAQSRGAVNRRWEPGWAIGSWFIPFANWVIPKLVMNEIDRMSNPELEPPIQDRWTMLPRLVASDVWWVSLLIGFALTIWAMQYPVSTATSGPEVDEYLAVVSAAHIAYTAAATAAAIVTYAIGRRLAEDPDAAVELTS